jgi:hypothetical protein
MPPIFQPVKITQSTLDTTPVSNGRAYFVQDSERLFFDYDQSRTEIRDIIVLETEAERSNLIAPKNKFYFIVETTVMWLYRAGTWIPISGGSSSGISLRSQSFTGGANIESIVLDETLLDKSNIVYINIDNTLLLQENYNLDTDGRTIRFTAPITSELAIEVVYTVGGSAVAPASVVSLNSSQSPDVVFTTATELVLTAGVTYQVSLSGHTNISFGGWSEGVQGITTVYLSMQDAYVLTLPASIRWKDGNSPSLEVDGNYIFEFRSIDGGNTIYGSVHKYI